jgi:hypothetical protein
MKNPSGNKLEKLVFGMFDQMVEGADKYVTKQGSTWLIFTESKKWVIEFTKDKTLWFNYNIFQGELELIGKDCTEERDLIKNWFESRFLNKPKVWATFNHAIDSNQAVEDTIQNGVKETVSLDYSHIDSVLDTIENGVKETKEDRLFRTIHVMNAIVNGVKHVEDGDWLDQDERINDIIEDGVKETKESMLESLEQIDHQVTNSEITENINDAIENGVKKTKEISNISLMSEIFKVNAKQAIRDGVKELKVWKSNRCEEHGYFEFVDGIPTYTPMIQVKDVLENGVKELKELPDKSGEFRGYGDWYRRQGNMTKPHTEYVKEVIEDSYNHRGRVEGIIRNTDKDGI